MIRWEVEHRVGMGGEKMGSRVESRDGSREDGKWSREQGGEKMGKKGSIVKMLLDKKVIRNF